MRRMRRTTAALGTALLVAFAALGAGATPASAQPHVDCWQPLSPGCAVVNKVLADLPGYVSKIHTAVLTAYEKVTGTAECVVFGDCP